MINLRNPESIRTLGRILEANHTPPYKQAVVQQAELLLQYLGVEIPSDPGMLIALTQNKLMSILDSTRKPLWDDLSTAYFNGNRDQVITLLKELGFDPGRDPMHQASALFMRKGHNPLNV